MKKLFIFIVLIFLLVSCYSVGPTRPNPSVPLARYVLQDSDLPEGWFFVTDGLTEENEGISYMIGYQGSKDVSTAPYLRQWLTEYSDEQSAIESYELWQAQWFTAAWIPMPEADFTPDNADDVFRYGCMNVSVNSNQVTSCRYLQQHKRFISLVLVNIDNETMNFAQFNEALQKMDERIRELGNL